MTDEAKLKIVSDTEAMPIKKPEFALDAFRSGQPTSAGVGTLLDALPHHKIADAKDYCRLHPDEPAYWSPELCFCSVPIKGTKRDQLHLITEQLAMRFLPSQRVLRFRLALATKPNDVFFLCHVPTQNVDNSWNFSSLQACELARTRWVEATSRKAEGVEAYRTRFAQNEDAFPAPRWPKQTLNELIYASFTGRMVTVEDHPALLRLIGAKQTVS
jgi:hypothetical protein